MSDKKWYQPRHQFTPYSTADGRAVKEEFDAIATSFDRIPEMRDDGKGFAVAPVIPDPTQDDHPVPYSMFKNGENSVAEMKRVVEQKAQEVATNTASVARNTATATAAQTSASASSLSAAQSEHNARHYAEQARTDKDFVAQAEQNIEAQNTNVNQKAQQVSNDADEVRRRAYALGANPATKEMAGVVKLSSETESDAEDKAATPKAVKTLWNKLTELTNNLLDDYLPRSGGSMKGALKGKLGVIDLNNTRNAGFVFDGSPDTGMGSQRDGHLSLYVRGKVAIECNPDYLSFIGAEQKLTFDHRGDIHLVDTHTGRNRAWLDLETLNSLQQQAATKGQFVRTWYPHHYAGTEVYKNYINRKMVTVLQTGEFSSSAEHIIHLPEKYNGHCIAVGNAWIISHPNTARPIACVANVEDNGTKARVWTGGAWDKFGLKLIVIGYF